MASERKPKNFPAPIVKKVVFHYKRDFETKPVTEVGGFQQESAMGFAHVKAALDWCRHHATTFVYSPVNVLKN